MCVVKSQTRHGLTKEQYRNVCGPLGTYLNEARQTSLTFVLTQQSHHIHFQPHTHREPRDRVPIASQYQASYQRSYQAVSLCPLQTPPTIITKPTRQHIDTMAEPRSLHALLVSIEPLDVATKVFVCFLLVSACFFVLFAVAPASSKKSTKLRASWALKSVGVIHALIVAGASVWALFYEPGMHEITTGVLKRDADSVRWPLIHQRSDVLAAAAPLTLAYFVFDLLLVPVWEGRLMVSAHTWEAERRLRLIWMDTLGVEGSYMCK